MTKLSYIKEYVTLAETLNYTKAAEILFTSQPAISRHIAIIEEDMGVKLFVRDTRNVNLTTSGQAVYERFKDILEIYSQANEEATLLASGKIGKLKISSPYYWTEDFTEPIIKKFLLKYPQCNIKVISCQPSEGFDQMMERQSDFALSMETKDIDEDIRRIKFAQEGLGVIMSSNHPLSLSTSVKLEEFNNCKLILLGGSKAINFNNYILSLFDKRHIKPQAISYTQQVDTLGLAIQETSGVGLLPYGVRNMNRSYLKTVPLEDSDCVLSMCFYYRIDNENPIIPQFIQVAKEFIH